MHYQQLTAIPLPQGKKVYFASDFHLGIPTHADSIAREKIICAWLHSIASTAQHIFLLGDLFDAWLEYKTVVPRGHVRLLGTLATLRDAGISITVFSGNHDLWMYGYFEEELNIPVLHAPAQVNIGNHLFFLGHGDGLGPGDAGYKLLKSILRNKFCQWLYQRLHPNFGIWLARFFSEKGMDKKEDAAKPIDAQKEYLVQFCQSYAQQHNINYFLFGHRHHLLEYELTPTSKYYNLGDWLQFNSYAVYDGNECTMQRYIPT